MCSNTAHYCYSAGNEPIHRTLSELKKAHLIVVEGTLYPLLTRLKNDGLLAYEWEESTQGPPRKYYVITPVGEAFLSELEDTWNGLNKTVNHLKEL